MLSKGIMVLALLALVYLLLVTMEVNPLESFTVNQPLKPSKVEQPTPVERQPVEQPPAPVERQPVEQPPAPVERQPVFVKPVEAKRKEEPFINYQENFEEEEVVEPRVEDPEDLLIGAQEAQLHYTNMFFQNSSSDRNVKNPTYDLRGEQEIPFNPTYAPFNSSANVGKPLSDTTLTRN